MEYTYDPDAKITLVHSRFSVTHERYGLYDSYQTKNEAMKVAKRLAEKEKEVYTVYDNMARRGSVREWKMTHEKA